MRSLKADLPLLTKGDRRSW